MGIIERKEREREARRDQILTAAQSEFQLHGLGQTSMDDIAKEAELAKGTIYLYYKNKDELLLGLVLRGFELFYDLMVEFTNAKTRGIEKVVAIGEANRSFAENERFLFSLMNVSEPPPKTNISSELIEELSQTTDRIWKLFYEQTEIAKAEGDIKPEVNGFTLVLSMWLSSTGVLRMFNKCLFRSENSVFKARKDGIRLEYIDWTYVYRTTMRMLLDTVVTEQGRSYLDAIEWKSLEQIGLPDGLGFMNPVAPTQTEVVAS